MLSLKRQVSELRNERGRITAHIDDLQRRLKTEQRPSSQYTLSGLKRVRDDTAVVAEKAAVSDAMPIEAEPVIKKPKLATIVAVAQVNFPEMGSEDRLQIVDDSKSVSDAPKVMERKRSRDLDAARSKRMFGALLGHLNKAKENITEEKRAERQLRRASIELHVQERIQNGSVQIRDEKIKSLEEAISLEQENLNKTLESLVVQERKIRAVKMVERHNSHAGLIQTIAMPVILWKPKSHSSKTKKMLLKSRKRTKEVLREALTGLGYPELEELEAILEKSQQPVEAPRKPLHSRSPRREHRAPRRDRDRDASRGDEAEKVPLEGEDGKSGKRPVDGDQDFEEVREAADERRDLGDNDREAAGDESHEGVVVVVDDNAQHHQQQALVDDDDVDYRDD